MSLRQSQKGPKSNSPIRYSEKVTTKDDEQGTELAHFLFIRGAAQLTEEDLRNHFAEYTEDVRKHFLEPTNLFSFSSWCILNI
jgi:hypothetical protein